MIKTPNYLKKFSIGTVWLWFGMFAIIPIVLTLITSFLQPNSNFADTINFTLINYTRLFNHNYLRIMVNSIYLAGSCTLICLIISYPFTFIIARSNNKYRSALLLLVIIPFWTSSLIRTYAIMAVIKAKGLLNALLLALHIIHQPLPILYSYTGVLIGCVYDFLPFMILPLYASIEKLNPVYLEAARDLGASKTTTFLKVILPLTLPGIVSGSLLVFLPAITMFYIPALLGGAQNLLLGNLIEHQFLAANNWPMGATLSMFITMLLGLLVTLYWINSSTKNRNNSA